MPRPARSSVRGTTVKTGEIITLDGSTGEIILGVVPTVQPELSGDFAELMAWADEVRTLGIRANAETPADAAQAREFGAEGIGLCRTEHMFFEGDRIVAVRQMILADDEKGRRTALAKIQPMQRQDFVGLFEIMAGLPVTIRLLDPPLHEFLPKTHADMEVVAKDLGVDVARDRGACPQAARVQPDARPSRRAARHLLSRRSTRCRRARSSRPWPRCRRRRGKTVIPEIMIPLVATKKELDLMKAVVDQVAAEVSQMSGEKLEYLVGTMIELPRAGLRAGEIAETAEFFSFGTNDLTQTTFGLSRDDSASFLEKYQQRGILEHDPFASLDIEGVGELIEIALRARPQGAARPQGRHLRRAWRRSGLGVLLPQGRPRLRLVLALPRADRAAGGGAGGPGRPAQDGMTLSTRFVPGAASVRWQPRSPAWSAIPTASRRNACSTRLGARPRAHVVGVTGPPGVGKSSLVRGAGRGLAQGWQDRRRDRRRSFVQDQRRRAAGRSGAHRPRFDRRGHFVRSMAARDRLGGLADQTLAAMVVMRALFDRVLIETVGVGQSETDVAGVADTVVFCVQPGSGDSLQFMKAGIVEIPHLIVVTKADLGAAAERARADVAGALSLATAGDWPVKTLAVSSRSGAGIEALMEALESASRASGQLTIALSSPAIARVRAGSLNRLRERFGREGIARLATLGFDARPAGRCSAIPATARARRAPWERKR